MGDTSSDVPQTNIKLRFLYVIAPCIWWSPARRDAAARCGTRRPTYAWSEDQVRPVRALPRPGSRPSFTNGNFPFYHASPGTHNNSRPYPSQGTFRVSYVRSPPPATKGACTFEWRWVGRQECWLLAKSLLLNNNNTTNNNHNTRLLSPAGGLGGMWMLDSYSP